MHDLTASGLDAALMLASSKKIKDVLIPELSSLDRQVGAWGEDEVIRKFPALEEIVLNRRDIDEEVARWMAKTL